MESGTPAARASDADDRAPRPPRAKRAWAWLALASLLLVSAGEGIFALVTNLDGAEYPPIRIAKLAINAAILLAAAVVLFSITNRLAFSTALVYGIYAALVASSILKIQHMHSAVHPLDVITLPDFAPFAKDFLGIWGIAALAIVLLAGIYGLVRLWRKSRLRCPIAVRALLAIISAGLLTLGARGHELPLVAGWLEKANIGDVDWAATEAIYRNGVLLEFVREIPKVILKKPDGYSESAVIAAMSELRSLRPTSRPSPATRLAPATRPAEPVDLIVIIVESLMDPADLGLKYTADPITVINRLRQRNGGWAVIPGYCGGSASTEFEVLTGMSMAFVPPGSHPYKQYIRRSLPALPDFLRKHGYETIGVYADWLHLWNRNTVCPRLGFGKLVWILDAPGLAWDPAGRAPSDECVMENIIWARDRVPAGQPCFILAFTNASHSPYNYNCFETSPLDVIGAPSDAARKEIKTYINAIAALDKAIGKLVDELARSPRKTLLVVMGDHLPPLVARCGVLADGPVTPDLRLKRQRVPLAMWSNYPLPSDPVLCSANMLPGLLLERIGLEPDGFLAASDLMRRKFQVFSPNIAVMTNGDRFVPPNTPPAAYRAARAYEMLQYDVLFGERYVERQ